MRFPAFGEFEPGADPIADAVDRVNHPRNAHDPEVWFSPEAANYLPTAQAMIRAQQMPVVPARGPVASYTLANCGRRILPLRRRSETELRRLSVEQAKRESGGVTEFLRCEYEHDEAADIAAYGGSPIETVVVYGVKDAGNLEFLVSAYWTPKRVAELVCRALYVHDCFFCDTKSKVRLDTYLLLGCGGVTRIMACCDRCESRFRNDMPVGLTWLRGWDDWLFLAGFPDERRL
ncbi:hypothetical protein [Gordonia polyisoprenivorans]|uniref:hypothetical protein n=1 Tax=Gordonia polyisoprenivorans TaxID=84595 RepID=UPI001AD64F04|nr:hypothetical protein [Gordonia polyisoprenivorans]QTI67475.1 hypothetical protein J6U32_17975 [Gordonia polyisoprenivorans]